MGGEARRDNPRLATPTEWFAFVQLWSACRAGMGGIAHWPDAGGVADQAAWIVDAFARLAALDAEFDREERALRGGA